jgi:UDP-N-acetylmuramate--alanine ligase
MTRDAATIGAGLDPVRTARPIRSRERIHVVGAAGAGASAAALLARAAGALVDGCDPGMPSPYSAALEAAAISVHASHDPRHVSTPPSPDRLAVTKALTAIDPDHPELRAARDLGIAVEPWQQVIADAAFGRDLIAVAGTHGKSTTAGWLVHVLVGAGKDPSAFVGALLPPSITGGPAATARSGRGASFVVEADEYAGNFDAYLPRLAVLTSAEWDHPDVFADEAAVVEAFERWLRRMPEDGVIVANVADHAVASIVQRVTLDRRLRIVAVALTDSTGDDRAIGEHTERDGPASRPLVTLRGRIVATDPGGTTLELRGLEGDGSATIARLPTAGRHNAANALCVAGAALQAGAPPDAVVHGLTTFPGIGRRLERVGEAAGVVIYDDYGHHPTAIRETIAAVRQREPGRRVWAVYEPLTYHRTAALLEGFAQALGTADAVAVADIWAGRDPDQTVASATGLAEEVARSQPGMAVQAPGSVESTAAWLAREVRPGDVVLVMGGGRSYRIATGLLERLEDAG